MKKFFTLLLLLTVVGCSSSPNFIYANTGKTITVLKWQDGILKKFQEIPGAGTPGALAYNPKHQTLYSATGGSPKNDTQNGRIYSIQKDGTLTLKQKFLFPHGYAQFTVDNSNNFLMGASYATGYNDIFKLDLNGVPQLTDTVYEGKNTAHAILFSPDDKYVYVPYVKQFNSLYQYSLDRTTGKLKALNPPQAKVGPNAGPRHFAMHPNMPIIYTSNEQALGVSVYNMNENGTLKLKQVCPANDSKAGPGKSASSLVVTPDGKYVFSAQRGKDPKDNFIHNYKIKDDGTLLPSGKTVCDQIPWIIKLSTDSKYLFVSATTDKTMTSFKINSDGSLTKASSLDLENACRHMVVIEQ